MLEADSLSELIRRIVIRDNDDFPAAKVHREYMVARPFERAAGARRREQTTILESLDILFALDNPDPFFARARQDLWKSIRPSTFDPAEIVDPAAGAVRLPLKESFFLALSTRFHSHALIFENAVAVEIVVISELRLSIEIRSPIRQEKIARL